MILISNLVLNISDNVSAVPSTEIYGTDKKTYINIGSGIVFKLSWNAVDLVDHYNLVIKRYDPTLNTYYNIFDKNIGLVNEFYVDSPMLPIAPTQYLLTIYLVAYSKTGIIATSNILNPYISKGSGTYVKDKGANFVYSTGLSFYEYKDVGEVALIDLGTCLDTCVVIPPTTPDGKSVNAIDIGAFVSDTVTSVFIPKSITNVWKEAFYDCPNLTDVYYAGTEAEWSALSIGSDNEPLLNANIHYNSRSGVYAEPIMKRALGFVKITDQMMATATKITQVLTDSEGNFLTDIENNLLYATSTGIKAKLLNRLVEQFVDKDGKAIFAPATKLLESTNGWAIVQQGYTKDAEGTWHTNNLTYEVLQVLNENGEYEVLTYENGEPIYIY